MATETIRTWVASEVARRGVAPVARDLGVDRSSVTTYLADRARPGTVLLIETTASILAGQGEPNGGER